VARNEEHEAVDQYEGKDSTGSGERHGFQQELPGDVAAARADGLRIPISRVRSVTLTSMMFITPTPPMSRPIALEHHRRYVNHQHDAVELSTSCAAV